MQVLCEAAVTPSGADDGASGDVLVRREFLGPCQGTVMDFGSIASTAEGPC